MTLVDGNKWKRIRFVCFNFSPQSIHFYRHSTTPMMSQQKLEKTLPLIENAAKILVKDLIEPGKEYDTKEISSAYTIKAIMSSGFSIGNETYCR